MYEAMELFKWLQTSIETKIKTPVADMYPEYFY